MKAGIYLRISDDKDGTQTATERQREDSLKYVEAQGWEAAEVFEDAGISAYKRKARPEFERMIQAARSREIDVVIAWNMDRLTRQLLPFARLMDACEQSGAFIITLSDHVDTRSQAGQFIATMLAGHAKMSSADTARRVARKHEELVKQGRPNIGRRAFGYNARRTAIIGEEAALIRSAMDRIISGESLHGIAFDWDRRAIRTPTGRAWTASMLRQMLLSPGLSAQREHNGVLMPGNWPAIVTPDETLKVRQTLASRPSISTSGRVARKYLLTGLVRCGKCGENLSANRTHIGISRYACIRRPDRRNCGHLSRNAEPIEEMVKTQAIAALDSGSLAEFLQESTGSVSDALIAAIRADEEALEEAHRDYYVDRLIERADFYAVRAPLQKRIEDNRLALAKLTRKGLLYKLQGAGQSVAKEWDTQGLEWQRAVLSSLIDHITILPAGRGARCFRPELVNITWKF